MDRTREKRRWLRMLIGPAVVLVLLAAAAAWYLWPRTQQFFTDGNTVWPGQPGQAAVRSVLWEPGQPIDPPINGPRADYQPRLSPDGGELYFTRGMAGANSDLFVARRTATGWSQPQPVAEANTEHDEIGPCLSPDGDRLAFYSNRPGGHGGYDIYVCRRGGDGTWGPPENIGPGINGPANEYDPVFAPAGQALLFSSNRRSLAGAGPWSGTLRARGDGGRYDLFIAELDDDGLAGRARPMDGLNTEHNEGQPAFSPDGDFLYFASDRPGGQGGYDLYRVRVEDLLAGLFARPDNLGQPINTAANEMDPAISVEGFAIYFSSDRPCPSCLAAEPQARASGLAAEPQARVSQPDEPAPVATQPESDYNLFYSRSREVVPFTVTTHRDLAAIWRSVSWPIIGLILSVIALAILLSLCFDRRHRPSVIAACLLVSVMLHLIGLIAASFYHIRQRLRAMDRDQLAQRVEINLNQLGLSEATAQLRSQISQLRERSADVPSPDRQPTPEQPAAPQPVEQPTVQLAQAQPESVAPERPEPPAVQVEQTPVDVQPQAARPTQVAPPAPEPVALAPREVARPAEQPAEQAAARPVQPSDPNRVALAEQQVPAVRPVAKPPLTPVQVRPQNVTAEQPAPQPIVQPAPQPQVAPRPVQPAVTEVAVVEPTTTVRPAEQQPIAEPAPAVQPTPAEPVAIVRAEPELPMRLPAARPAVQSEVRAAIPAAPTMTDRPLLVLENSPRPADPPVATAAQPSIVEPVADVAPQQLSPAALAVPREIVRADRPADLAVQVSPVAARHADVDEPQRPAGPKPVASAAPSAAPVPAAPNIELENRFAVADASRPSVEVQAVTLTPKTTTDPEPNPVRPVPADPRRHDAQPGPTIELAVQADVAPPIAPRPTAVAAIDAPRVAGSAPRPAEPTTPRQPAEPMRLAFEPVSPARPESAVAPAPPPPAADVPVSVASAMIKPADPNPGQVSNLSSPVGQVSNLSSASEFRSPERVVGELAHPTARPATVKHVPAGTSAAPGALSAAQPIAPQLEVPRPATAPVAAAIQPAAPAERPVTLKPITLAAAQPVELAPAETVYKLRKDADRESIIEQLGGSKETEQAVKDALDYLARTQLPDGSWPTGTKRGENVGVTGLSLLAFLGNGQTHAKPGPHRQTIARAVEFLLKNVKPDGDIRGAGQMYSQGIGAMALCEAYSMTGDEKLKEPARKAVQFILNAQTPDAGWRYTPRTDSDTSVLGWQLMAIRSGQIAGFELDTRSAWRGAEAHLKRVGAGRHGGVYLYQPGASSRDTVAMTAEGLLCRQLLESRPSDDRTGESIDHIMRNSPGSAGRRGQSQNFYFWYYGTLALHAEGGEPWKKWNAAISKMLVETQHKSGPAKGSWAPQHRYDQAGGPAYIAAMGALTLEVYYRYLPFYKSAGKGK